MREARTAKLEAFFIDPKTSARKPLAVFISFSVLIEEGVIKERVPS